MVPATSTPPATTPPILTSGAGKAAPAPAAVLRERPALSQSRAHVDEPVSQPSAPTFTTVRQGQAHWLTAQETNRLSPTRMTEELTSGELDAAQVQAAGLELDATDRQPQEMGTEEVRVEENLDRARSMLRV